MDDSGARGGGSPNGGIRAYKLTEAERGRPTSVLRPSIRREQNEKRGRGGEGGLGFWEDSKEAKRNARHRNPSRAIPESRNANSTGILNGRYSTVAFSANAWPCMRHMGLLCPACFCWENENAVEP